MPSWPARLISGSSISARSGPTTGGDGHDENIRERRPSLNQLIGVDSRTISAPILPRFRPLPSPIQSSSSTTTSSLNRSRSSHGRSISNPFPTIFGYHRKTTTKEEIGLDSTDDELDKMDRSPMRRGKAREGNDRGEPQTLMASGKCMTCDATMRWTPDAHSFRCTVCLTINDLTPREGYVGHGEAAPSDMNASVPGHRPPPQVPPLSLERTQAILDRCLDRYLEVKRLAVKIRREHSGRARREAQQAGRTASTSPAGSGPVDRRVPEPALSSPFLAPPSPMLLVPPENTERQSGWAIPQRPPVTSPGIYSTSSPSWIPSPLEPDEKSNSTGSNSTLPAPPTRQPPPPPGTPSGRIPRTPSPWDSSPRPVSRGSRSPRPRTREVLPIVPPRSSSREKSRDQSIFRPLEEYILACFGSLDALNASFLVIRPSLPMRSASEDMGKMRSGGVDGPSGSVDQTPVMSPLDAKTLLLGDVAENGSWWTGHRTDGRSPSLPSRKDTRSQTKEWGHVNYKTPRIDWVRLGQWYQTIIKAGQGWKSRWEASLGEDVRPDEVAGHLRRMEEDIEQARLRLQRTLLHATENLLKRPGRPLKTPQDTRFLLMFLANPLLYPTNAPSPRPQPKRSPADPRASPSSDPSQSGVSRPFPAIVKRIVGLLAHLPNECHHVLVSWFSRLSEHRFRRMVELIGGFVTYRLSRPHKRQRSDTVDPTAGLIPEFSGAGVQSSARLHAALGVTPCDTTDDKPKPTTYGSDWQLRAAAKVMALLFTANNSGTIKRSESDQSSESGRLPGQIVPTSEFYISLLDYSDLIADFEAWELRRGGFSFCQYPFFLSIGAKIRVLQYDARRQMELKAREAFFDSILGRKVVNQHLVLRVRRDCLVEDSLRAVSEVVGAGQEEIKKGLRIDFVGEEGVDAGGLRKEWFLLLVRDIFDPQHGLFVYDEDSRYCYFNPYCFETSDQFFLVGVLLGLAIYNSTILDIALPPFAFKKLLAAAPVTPTSNSNNSSVNNNNSNNNIPRPSMNLTLDDLAEYRPSLAHGLRQVLQYEGDVESTFSLDFVVDTNRYGQIVRVPLCPNGEEKPVTNTNRREFVDAYVHYLLDTAVARQFEPFKRGFYTVCGGNALSLFRAEEIELLVRGSDERLNVESLKGVAAYDDWGDHKTGGGGGSIRANVNVTNGIINSNRPAHSNDKSKSKFDPDSEPVIQWFWSFLDRLPVSSQRKILGFITGSDRIPALGATHLTIRLVCLGDDCDRFPVARTCFNALCLYRYRTKEKLEGMLWRAVEESEGFGLK